MLTLLAQAGIGYELCKMLYAANGIVYLTSRTLSTAHSAAQKIRDSHPESKGRVEGLQLDLTDLRTVKPCAEEFLKRENDLDVLFNNAGVQMKPLEGRTVQGYEVRVGVNCLGHFILTQLLVPTIKATAAKRRREGYPEGSVRILFAGSIVIDASSPPGGVEYDNDGSPKFHATTASNYGQSKAGNLFLTKWFRDELKYDGILCVVSVSFAFNSFRVAVSDLADTPLSSASIQATSTIGIRLDEISCVMISQRCSWSGSFCTH